MNNHISITTSSIFISKSDLIKHKYHSFKFIANENLSKSILGVILDSNQKPLKNACIEVFEEDLNKSKSLLGRSFSNEFGEYGFTLEINPCFNYIFQVYSPLI